MVLYRILDMVLEQGIDRANGKIRRVKRIYRYDERGYINPSGVFFKAEPDDTGKLCSFWKKSGVANCPAPPCDTPVHTLKAGGVLTSVPYSYCRVCIHHIEPAWELKYPCCDLLRQKRRVK